MVSIQIDDYVNNIKSYQGGFMKLYRQGDLIFKEISEVPKESKLISTPNF